MNNTNDIKKTNDTNNIGTPFDDVFRTLLEKCDKLIIPVINEIFQTDYEMDEKVTLLSDIHYVPDEDGNSVKRITDSCILIRNKMYHLECESRPKTGIEIRMVEYDFHIAMSHRIKEDNTFTLNFPDSAVLFLRNNRNTPDELTVNIIMPNNQKCTYTIPAIKVQEYSKEEIFDKNLLMFLPFYIMRFEDKLTTVNENATDFDQITSDYQYIYQQLCHLEAEKVIDIDYLHNLIGLITRLIEVVAHASSKVKGEIITMGGKVLVLESEIIRAEATAQGMAQGMVQGMAQGMIENILEFLNDYGTIPDALKEILHSQNDTDILKKWCKLSARVSSIEEFEQKMYD